MSENTTFQEMPFEEAAQALLEQLQNGGAFLTTQGTDGTPNTMTIGWGGPQCFFNKPVMMVPVRKSRHTHLLLSQNGEFTVSVPLHPMKRELAFAGTQSGRDVRKFEGHGLTAAPAQMVKPPIVAECELHLECRVFAQTELAEPGVSPEALTRWYATRDMHSLYFGEVLRCYQSISPAQL